jgi:hypothetical protein
MKPSHKSPGEDDRDAVIRALREEVAARVAEADWLKGRYEAELRAALSKHAASSVREAPVAEAGPGAAVDSEVIARLQGELDRATAAEVRYLDRIEELKDRVERLTKGEPTT